MKKKSRLIIIIVGVFLLLVVIAIPITINYRENVKRTVQINKEKQIKIAAKIVTDKQISDKVIADKLEAKRAAAKKADENARLLKLSNKKIADEKLRLAKLNTGMTLSEALAIGEKLDTYNLLKPLYSNTQLINGTKFFVFELYDLNGNDEGADWHMCISKNTGKAYRYYSGNTLIAYVPDDTSKPVVNTNNSTPAVSSRKSTTINYTMDNNVFTRCNYPSGTTLRLKVGQIININGSIVNGSDFRTMFMNGGDIFSYANTTGPNMSLTMSKVGKDQIDIVPNYSDWDRAYIIYVIVTN